MSSSTVDMIYVIGGSVIGLVIFIYPILTLNRIIRLQKETILENIAERVKKTGEDSRFFPAANPDGMETATTYMQEYINMRTIRESRDYPVNIRQVLSVLSALVLPFLINYLSTVLF
jgi:hypothetical protein